MNFQIENAISSAISERVIPQMQSVVETVLARQLECVQPMSKRPYNSGNDMRNLNEDNLTNRDFHSQQNLTERQEESPYT